MSATLSSSPTPKVNTDTHVHLPADTNQALGLAQYALDFMSTTPGKRGEPSPAVLEKTNLFHTDAVIAGISALSLGTNAPNLLRNEALGEYRTGPAGFGSMAGLPWAKSAIRTGVPVFGSSTNVAVEKALVANCAAVREWDTNGTNFGFNPELGHTAGEFGHNDFYSVAVAAAQLRGMNGAFALRGMILLDEIRGRLAEVFSLKSYKIDHVVHGAIAGAATFGAMLKATPEQIADKVCEMALADQAFKGMPRLFLCPQNLLPTKHARGFTTPELNHLLDHFGEEHVRAGEIEAVDVCRIGGQWAILNGHKRVALALHMKVPLVPGRLLGQDDEILDYGVTARSLFEHEVVPDHVAQWERAFDFRFH